jgi:polysaccharide deacetylase family protein (PEP-CTERM system associated)
VAIEPSLVLSFDVEEPYMIEAATGLALTPALKGPYIGRLEAAVRWLMELLDAHKHRATFFVVGSVARRYPALVRALHAAGHEIASHGHEHVRLHTLEPAAFRDDLRRSRDTLEQITGAAVLGYRAPTFSLTRRTAWAVAVLAETGWLYDSSVYPVRHDRYGIPRAPRSPFLLRRGASEVLELPPATLRLAGLRLPAGGGGSFRLFPLAWMQWAIAQTLRAGPPHVATLYFHPWEFDPDQPRLPLDPLNRFRTYAGLARARPRLQTLLARPRFVRAIDVAAALSRQRPALACFELDSGPESPDRR